MRYLTIQIEPDIEVDSARWLERAKRGLATGEYQGEWLSFSTPEQFFRELTPNRWQMVRQMMGAGVVGVRALARTLGRDVRRVHEDAAVLVELGMLERTEHGALCCPYGRIQIDMTMEAQAQETAAQDAPVLAEAA